MNVRKTSTAAGATQGGESRSMGGRKSAGARTARKGKESLDSFRDQMLGEDPKFKRSWDALEAKRKIVTILLRLRAKADLTQKELAERAGWQPSFVSRLESFPREGEKLYMPDLVTLMRYAEVCESNLGVIFGEPKARGAGMHISESLALGESPRFNQALEAFSNTDVSIKNKVVRSVAKTR